MYSLLIANRGFQYLFIVFTWVILCLQPAFSESHIKITGVAGQKAPDVPLADTSMPDVVLDASLAGDVNVDVKTSGVPDGTKVKVKIKDEENKNAPSGEITDGVAVVPLHLEAGNAKVLYLETDPFVPTITKSASGGMLDVDADTIVLYRLDDNLSDAASHNPNLLFSGITNTPQYVEGVSQYSHAIEFQGIDSQEVKVSSLGPNGTGFTYTPKEWTAEFFIKPLASAGSRSSASFLLLDSHICSALFIGKRPWTFDGDNRLTFTHGDAKGALNRIDIANPLIVGQWAYIAVTHDGHIFRLYINGQERGSVISDGNIGPQPWGNFGIVAGSLWGGLYTAQVQIDEIRISSVVRSQREILANTSEFFGTNYLARTAIASKDVKDLKLTSNNEQTKKQKVKKEIRAQVATSLPQEGEVKQDKDTVALFHFNGTTKDSVTKKVLVGDPESIDFEEGKNNKELSSVSFEGKDDLILINKKLFDTSPKEWTVDFFSKPDLTISPLPTGILTIDNGQIFAMISYAKAPNGKTTLSGFSLDANGKSVTIAAEADFPTDKWTHLALVYENKKLQFLVNGKPYGEADLPTLYKKGDGAINIGSDGGDGIFNGQIDELRISDVARSASELEVYAKR